MEDRLEWQKTPAYTTTASTVVSNGQHAVIPMSCLKLTGKDSIGWNCGKTHVC